MRQPKAWAGSAWRLMVLTAFSSLLAGPATAASPSPDRLPGFEQVKQAYRASDALVMDRQGRPLQRVRQDFHGRRGDWLPLSSISPALTQAVLVSEDRRFLAHHGVDMQAVAAAAWQRLSSGSRRGASTLSMQLVGMLDEPLRASGARTVSQKVRQIVQAWALERRWSKDEIFEAYLNLVPLRGEVVGVDAAARVLFQKHADGLDARESALLAAMLRSPNVSPRLLADRACGVLLAMSRPQEACLGLEWMAQRAARRGAAPLFDAGDLAPHAARRVLAAQARLVDEAASAQGRANDERSNATAATAAQVLSATDVASETAPSVLSSLDADLQRFVLASVQHRLGALQAGVGVEAAVVVLDNESSEVRAYVGTAGPSSSAPWVDHAQALRQAGSTLKPFLYAQAFDERRLTPASLLNDSPLDLATATGLYMPQNYDERFSGWVSSRTALASSLNIPAVRVLTMVSPEAFHDRLVRLGLPLDQEGGFYGFSLALGSADVTLLSLVNAYRALANGGRMTPVQWLAKGGAVQAQAHEGSVSDPAPQLALPASHESELMRNEADSPPVQAKPAVFSEAAAWLVGNVLADRQARVRTFGMDSPLETAFWSAVKTGTSKDMRDNWCVGWSSRYTVGVWVGNSEGASMRDVSGVSGAGPIWQDVMNWLGTRQTMTVPALPAGVVAMPVSFQPAFEPERQEFFLAGTQQAQITALAETNDPNEGQGAGQAQNVGRPRIASPVSGTLIALDPDIPPAHQRLQLRAINLPQGQAVYWQSGEQRIGEGALDYWLPQPGRNRLTLMDAQGRQLDSVVIEVRGATRKPPETGEGS